MKVFKFSVIFLCVIFSVGFVITAAMLIKQNMLDIMINDNVNSMAHNVKYRKAAKISGVPVVSQKISCGYACIEMLSEYFGDEEAEIITEDILFEENGGRISTSTNGGFYNEIRKQFPDYKITRYKNIKNSELLEKIYDSVSDNMPVIFSYAAKTESEDDGDEQDSWTLHYGIAVEVDLPKDRIKIINPYGYTEIYTVNEFLRATRFESYENMEFYLKLGFAVEIFTKNTVYIFEPDSGEEEHPGIVKEDGAVEAMGDIETIE